MKVHVVRIGNSKGIRIPQKTLQRYRITEESDLELEERRDGILIRPLSSTSVKVSWELAYREMSQETAEKSEWAEWDALAGDGLK